MYASKTLTYQPKINLKKIFEAHPHNPTILEMEEGSDSRNGRRIRKKLKTRGHRVLGLLSYTDFGSFVFLKSYVGQDGLERRDLQCLICFILINET